MDRNDYLTAKAEHPGPQADVFTVANPPFRRRSSDRDNLIPITDEEVVERRKMGQFWRDLNVDVLQAKPETLGSLGLIAAPAEEVAETAPVRPSWFARCKAWLGGDVA